MYIWQLDTWLQGPAPPLRITLEAELDFYILTQKGHRAALCIVTNKSIVARSTPLLEGNL